MKFSSKHLTELKHNNNIRKENVMAIYSFTAMVPMNIEINADNEEEARELLNETSIDEYEVNMDNIADFAELVNVDDEEED
ncbi:MAG: hypothetical protein VZR53_13745 [Prevotella sp.]|nr:hypothetical protein [Prevotella sp.]